MKHFLDSEYSNKRNIYFNTRSKYGRNEDTIIFWYAITPKGRISTYWATLRFNSERIISKESKIEKINNMNLPKLPKGYMWSEPLLYSGSL